MEADIPAAPTLPPGFSARLVQGTLDQGTLGQGTLGMDVWDGAVRAAEAGVDPGTVFWSGAGGWCRAAFVLAPDRPVDADTVSHLGLLALFDGLAVLAPPQLPIQVWPPDGIAVDGGRVGAVRVASAPGAIPRWVVLGLEVAVDVPRAAPGDTPDDTCLAEEGLGDTSPADVLQHVCRHLLGWIDAWQDEGAAVLARTVAQRLRQAHLRSAA